MMCVSVYIYIWHAYIQVQCVCICIYSHLSISQIAPWSESALDFIVHHTRHTHHFHLEAQAGYLILLCFNILICSVEL